MSANEKNERLFYCNYVAKPSPSPSKDICQQRDGSCEKWSSSTTLTTPPRSPRLPFKSPPNLRKNILIDESLKIQMQYLSSRGPEVPRLSEDPVNNDLPLCSHPLCTPPSKRKNIFATATKKLKSNITSFIPSFKKTENEVQSRKVSSNKSATESVRQDGVRSTLRNTGMRKPFSVSAPVSAQNTPHQGRKRSKMLDLSNLNTSAIFEPISTQNENCIPTTDQDKDKNGNIGQLKKLSRPDSRNSNSGTKYSMSSIKKNSTDSTYQPDVKAADIKFSDYIQHRKNSQKKIVPPSPRSSPKQRKSSRHRAIEGQKSFEGTSTATSSQTSPRITNKNPCHWIRELRDENSHNESLNITSLSNPASPLFDKRTLNPRKEWDMQMKVDLKELCRVGSKAQTNHKLSSGVKNDRVKRRNNDESNFNIDFDTIPPLSPIPRRRHLGTRSKSSPNYRRNCSLDEQSKNLSPGDTMNNHVGTKNSGTVEGCQDFHGVSKDARNIMNDTMAHHEGNVESELIEASNEGTKSMPCTPFQTRKSSRKLKPSSDIPKYKPLHPILDLNTTSNDDENKSINSKHKYPDTNVNASDSTNLDAVSKSPRCRKRNSVLSPEMQYSEQRRSEISKSNIVVSHIGTPPACRRVSRSVLTASPDLEISSIGLNNGNNFARLEMKQIYLFVADAETQTDDHDCIYGSQLENTNSACLNAAQEFDRKNTLPSINHKLLNTALNSFQNRSTEIDTQKITSKEERTQGNKVYCPSPIHSCSEIKPKENCEMIPKMETCKIFQNYDSHDGSAFQPIRKASLRMETRVKRPGAIATEEPYPLGIGQRSKKELFRQVKLQEIEEQNESFDKTKENEAEEDERSRRRKVKSLTEHDFSRAEKSQKRWSNVEDGNKAGPESFNKGECKRLTWTEGKINKPKKNQGSNFDNLSHATTDIRSREKQRKSRNDKKGNSSISAFLSIQWCMGICTSVIIVVALLVVQSNSRYMISRGLLSRRRRQF